MTLTIGLPQTTDFENWAELYQGYADFYQVPMNDEIQQQVWHWIHDENQAFYCLMARNEEGQLLGLMHYRAMPSPLRGKMVGFLDDLYVVPGARKQGVAKLLFAELKAQAEQQGWPFVRWITAPDNHQAQALYNQLADKTPWLTYQMNCQM